MRRVLVVSPWARYSPHLETDLELMQRHLDDGDEVHHAGCDAELPSCDRNPLHDLVRCTMCVGKRDAGLALLSGDVRRVPLLALTAEDRAEIAALPEAFDTVDELKAFHVEDFDLGYGVLSSLVSFLRRPDPLGPENRECVRDLCMSSLAVYRSVQRHLDATAYDRVYVFNGRFAITRAVLRACRSRGVECVTHERGHDLGHFALFSDSTVHDLVRMERAVRDSWAAAPSAEERERIGASFYEERARGMPQAWFSFTAGQTREELPAGFDPERRNIVVFNSSEDEFASIGPAWEESLYDSQRTGIERIADALSGDPDVRLIVRVHPNLRSLDNSQTRGLEELAASRDVALIPAESPVDSYALLRAASTVVTFGSTIGIEAVYWGVPSVLVGQSFYRRLGGPYLPGSHEELVSLLSRRLEPGPREPALMYGYHMKTYGTPFRHFEALGVFDGLFRGRRVRPSLPVLGRAAVLRAGRPAERVRRRAALRDARSALTR